MTDLEKHLNQPGRAKLVKKVREKTNYNNLKNDIEKISVTIKGI